ncbi:Protein mlo2 [Schizosaccharomyces pombe]
MEETAHELTVKQYVEQQRELEREAREVLPYSFDTCTYSMGYLKQPLYACLTCQKASGSLNAVCYSCSISCHADHDLVDLFNKRHFRCDCGTTRTHSIPCNLRKSVDECGSENDYNHNFEGRFCICDTVYNPETEEGTMFQCILCEDWFHEKCLQKTNKGIEIPDAETFEWLVCSECSEKYRDHLLNQKHESIAGTERAPLFLSENFRENLCPCESCISLRNLEMPMLVAEEPIYEPPEDSEDGISEMNEDPSESGEMIEQVISSTMNDVLRILDRLPRVQANESVYAYNRLKSDLTDFLTPFARENRVVTKEDISNFFLERSRISKNLR